MFHDILHGVLGYLHTNWPHSVQNMSGGSTDNAQHLGVYVSFHHWVFIIFPKGEGVCVVEIWNWLPSCVYE